MRSGIWLVTTLIALHGGPTLAQEPGLAHGAQGGKRPVVAVFDVVAHAFRWIDDDRGTRLTNHLVDQVAGSGRYEVVPRVRLKRLLARQNRSSSCNDRACHVAIGRQLKADKSLTSELLKLGRRCVVELTLYDLRRATREAAGKAGSTCKEDDLLRSIREAVKRLVAGPPPAKPDVPGPPPGRPGKITVKGKRILLPEPIYFKSTTAQILERSHPVLDALARLLTSGQQGGRVRIEAHTDSRGAGEYNKVQTRRRADAVRTYLVGKGVAPERLLAVGYGEERPIASNMTAQGREQNRRVEFLLIP